VYVDNDEKLLYDIKQTPWIITSNGYVESRHSKHRWLHRLVLSHYRVRPRSSKHSTIDHINRDPLDNRRSNLRWATRIQQGGNTPIGPLAVYKGVSLHPNGKDWYSKCGAYRIGRFATAEEAARAYDKVAKKLYGSFANLNFP
jgi:hypothetical protein